MTPTTPSPEEKEQAIAEFRKVISTDVQSGIDQHERKMSRMGFLFLAIFVGVIALASVLP